MTIRAVGITGTGGPEGKLDGSVGHLIDGRESLECIFIHEHLLDGIFRVQFSLQFFPLASFGNELILLFHICRMEDLQGLDILRKGGLLIDDSFQLFILLLNGTDALLVLSHEVFSLQFHPLSKPCDFLILDNDPLVEIGPKLIFSLVEVLGDFIDLIFEEEDLELVVIDDGRFGLLQF